LLKDFVSKFAFNCPQLWHDKKGFAERVIKEANAYIKYMIK